MLKGLVHPRIKTLSLLTLILFQTHKTFIFGTQINIFLMKSESFLTLLRQQCNYHVFYYRKLRKYNFLLAKKKKSKHKRLCLYRVRKRFYQKYLNLCFEDEQMSYGFGATWGWVINVRILILGWTIPLSTSLYVISYLLLLSLKYG